MDGMLIDTEDIYTLCNNVLLKENGRPPLPWNIKAQLQGRPGPERKQTVSPLPQAAEIFHAWASLPIPRHEYANRLTALQREHFPHAQPLPGIPALLSALHAHAIPIALATSSHAVNFQLKTSHLDDLFRYFPAHQQILGDDTRIPPGRGKPWPDIYELALETINAELRARGEREVRKEECLVFEDSVPGVEAGRRAGMRVVWCPHPQLLKEYKGREEEVLAGSTRGQGEVAEVMKEAGVNGVNGVAKGWPGRKGDGWAELVETMEGFDLGKYGIGG
ncbi:MAG: hypothetical protein LQ342_000965 [Letrouitia transgressa]|nr:MAG: hypothetical protein LQ342_000965 [Letrouitia transgressa]